MIEHPFRSRLTKGSQLGPYRIESVLGEGGMGEVFRARDIRLDRVVAIKLVRADLAQRTDLRGRFEREAHALSALNHPHICSLYDIGEQDGHEYLVMEYVEGKTLATVLKEGVLPLNVALRYGAEIADALSAAHGQGITHRDLKPANIMVAQSGIKVLDFGLAKRSEHVKLVDEDEGRTADGATRAGEILGTVAYMAPEQAEGAPTDTPSDVFSLGVVLYEMLCGRRPFQGNSTLSTLASILREAPESPRKLRREIPEPVERLVLRCLEKKPEARYASAAEIHRELAEYQTARTPRWTIRQAVVSGIVLAVIIAGISGGLVYKRASRARWAEKEALPEIARRLEKHQLLSSLSLFDEAIEDAPASRGLLALTETLGVSPVTIETTPPGAEISITDYTDTDPSHWKILGESPLKAGRVPHHGYYRIRTRKAGFEPVELTYAALSRRLVQIRLHTPEDTPQGMVWLPAVAAGAYLSPAPPMAVSEFWLDKYEVTNRQFKQFVDAGGYQKQKYWKEPFIKNGRTLPWERAMEEFRDATGRPGPSTWRFGTFPEGKADFPVGGVSWYEAAAYAEFVQKSLPTVYHWYLAAGVGVYSDILSFSNFGGQGPSPVGMSRGLSPYGNYDMAGNIKEWVANPAGNRRYLLGGGWEEPSHTFQDLDARLPFDRAATFGFRCAKFSSPVSEALLGSVTFFSNDRRGDKPVDEQTFRILRDLHAYDKTDLNSAVQSVDDSSPYLRREDVTFQAAYGDERVLAHLYLPKNAARPYQVVAFFGTAAVLRQSSVEEHHSSFEFIVRSGRALIFPAYKGTLERGPMPAQSREAELQWSKDLGRSIDYLETRPDIDTTKLAYYGYSNGAAVGPRFIAVEPRFKAALFVSGGTFPKGPAELDSWNFAPHVRIPVLMVNGRDDFLIPVETSQLPLFHALGTPERDKKHVLYDGGHENVATRLDLVKQVLDWLDHYLGPVTSP